MTKIADLWNDTYDLIGQSTDDAMIEQLVVSVDKCDGMQSEKSLLRGYIGYHFPCRATSRINVREELESVLESDTGNSTAILYLAHYHYDSKEYEHAISYLGKINSNEYRKAGQAWRVLKILEMQLACEIHVSASTVGSEIVLDFVEKLSTCQAENSAVPSELVEAMMTNKSELAQVWTRPVFRNVSLELRLAIDKIAGVTTLKKETDILLA